MKGTIIYYGGFSLPDKNAAANRVVSNGKLFNSVGYNTVFLGASYDEKQADAYKPLSERADMFEESHPTTSKAWLKHIFSIKNLKNLSDKYTDVKTIILYNVPFITLCVAKKYFSQKGIEVAYDCTEWTQYTDGSFLKKAFKFIDEFFIRKFAHKIADKMIVISSLMEKGYKKSKKMLVLPPLIDINDEIWHQQEEKITEQFSFCFAGFPDGNKDSLDIIVEAFQELDSQFLLLNIVGITKEEFEKIYPDVKITEKNKNSVIFRGKQTHKEAIRIVSNSDCYIFIRESDRRNNAGFPTKFVESYTCGIPIITTDVSDIKKYMKNSSDGVVLEAVTKESIKQAMKVFSAKKISEKKSLKKTFHYESYSEQAAIWLE